MTTLGTDALLTLAAALGGALNAVVGGGSFVAFPALLFAGVAPVSANATTTLALWPGALASAFAYRRDMKPSRRLVLVYSLVSLVGGIAGALLLLHTSNTTFVKLIPWLMLVASTLFSFGGMLTARLRHKEGDGVELGGKALLLGALVQLGIATYGGFFGGGMGILMLATWTLLGMSNIHAMNGLRSVMGTLINGVALVAFVAADAVAWREGLVMMVGATLAGYGGAAVARKLRPQRVKRFVIAIAWVMTAYFFVHEHGWHLDLARLHL